MMAYEINIISHELIEARFNGRHFEFSFNILWCI